MDITLIKTFLEVIAAGNFVNASERLYVSQSAVSLRIKSLEEQLGRPLFLRSKSGITLTPAGEQFVRYAQTFLQVWEEAKQQVAVPQGYKDVLVIAGEYGLWNRLLIRWLPLMAEHMPDVAFRAEGFPISSGGVESGIKQFKQRLTGAGMRWSRAGAERMMVIRSAVMTDSFDDIWAAAA